MKILLSVSGEETVVDDETYLWAIKLRWNINNYGYFVTGSGNDKKLLHRMILNAKEGVDVDHINGNKKDNLKSNLRACSRQENNYNRGLRNDNTSGYRGVWMDKRNGRWKVEIKKDGKKYSLGSYETPEEAANVYNHKAVELFGEFAWLNNV